MIGLERVADLLSLVIWTGQVEGERPASLLLVAAYGSGKTSLLEAVECDWTHYVTDLTSRDISATFTRKPKVTHIVLGDLLTLFGHKSSVVDLSCRTLSVLTGERMSTDPMTGSSMAGKRVGLVSAIPPADFGSFKIRRQMSAGGLASRFLIARYESSPKLVSAVHQFIREDRYVKSKPTEIRPPPSNMVPVPVVIPAKITAQIQDISTLMKRRDDDLGYRPHLYLRSIVKASALRRGMRTASTADFDVMASASEFFASKEPVRL
jgi:hypothetical protein